MIYIKRLINNVIILIIGGALTTLIIQRIIAITLIIRTVQGMEDLNRWTSFGWGTFIFVKITIICLLIRWWINNNYFNNEREE